MTDRPGYTPDHILRGLSLSRRAGYLVAGLGGFSGATIIGLVWATEPIALPVRTQVAFAGMILIGVAWAGFAAWALSRRPLFAVDRVVAASLALTFSTLTTVGAVAVALARASSTGVLVGGGLGLALSVVSGILLIRAHAYRTVLLARRRGLEQHGPQAFPPGETATAPSERGSAVRTREPWPIGPLALALRHIRPHATGRRVAVIALILSAALLVGIMLLKR